MTRSEDLGKIRHWWWNIVAAVIVLTAAAVLGGCQKSPYGLSPKDPVTVTIWHYYTGQQKEEFDNLVQEFNETQGREQGIIVEAYNKGNINELSQLVTDSLDKKIGSDPLPTVFAVYADQAYELDQRGVAVDIGTYMTEGEQQEYVDAYLEEGRFDDTGSLKVFPVAKSTEVFVINQTDWEKFSAATGQTDASFSTWEGITRVAEEYYKWTDEQTIRPDDGKAFFGRDAFANYMIIGSMQLGHEIFHVENGKATLDFDRGVMKKLWDHYYIPYINGYFAAYGKFRSDDVKTGKLAAFVGSTSGISFFPSSVTLEDGTTYEIENKVYPLPNFAGTSPFAVSQGAGMMILKSDEKTEYAASVFLRWFTETDSNIRFSTASGYLPVKKEAGEISRMKEVLNADKGALSVAAQDILIGLETANTYQLYTTKPFPGGDKARSVLENSMTNWAEKDRTAVETAIAGGMAREEAVRRYATEKNFDDWYEDTRLQLEAIIGE